MHFPIRILFTSLACPVALVTSLVSGADEENAAEARLTWKNGESLPGVMVSANETELTWNSPLFAKPVPLSLAELRSITSDAKATQPKGSMAFNLRDGSRIYGDLTGFEGGWLEVASERHGALRIRSSQVTSIHRLKGGDVIWCGPFGEAGWKYPGPSPGPGRRLQSSSGGALESVAWRQRVTVPLDLPEKVEVEFRLSASVQPEFVLEAVAAKHKITLTTWKDELVLQRGNHFVSIGTLKPEDREVSLRLFWDRETGSGMISSPEGKLLAKWESEKKEDEDKPETPAANQPADAKVRVEIQGNMINRIAAAVFPGLVPGAPPAAITSKSSKAPENGVALINRGPAIKLEFLRVRKWDGKLPERTLSNPFRTRLELSGGPAIEGKIGSGTKESLSFEPEDGSAPRTIPMESIESLFFPAVPEEEDAEGPQPDEFRFADGTWLRGRFLGIEKSSARIESPASDEPLMAKLEGLRELRIFSAAPAEAEKDATPVPLSKQDKLVTGETTIHGTWHPAGGDKIQWRLAGASEPVEIASTAAMELTRVPPEDGDWPRSPALFHLSNGQVAPGELVAIHGKGAASVEYRSELFEPGIFSADDLHAIQFRGPEVNPEGFEDPGWQIVRGEKKMVTIKDGTVTMDPGGSWGHPSILVGDEVRFAILPSGYGTLRVRMFAEGVSSVSPSTNILLAHYGNEIYCGLEETPGQLNQRRDISVGNNKAANIRLSWDNTGTKLYVNGTMAVRIPTNEKAKRSGLGLILEPANLWGNGERQMKVSNFSLRAAPGLTWVPGVNAVAKERALFLPRFRKEDPPRHILLAPNGDVLRGTIVAAAGDLFSFRSRLEELSIPKDRVVAAIWLKPPQADEEETGEETTEESEKPEEGETEPETKARSEGPEPTHWLLLTSGARLGLAIEEFGPEFVTGHSQFLGPCRIPAEHIHLIRSTKTEPSPATEAFANWQLKKAPEPLAEAGGENSPMIGNDAPAMDLELLDGGRFLLSEEKGKVIVLDFWATWCGPCVRAIPDMIQEFSSFDRNRVRFIGVNQAEAPALIKPFIEQRGWNPFEVALDVETSAGQAFGVEGIPHTVIVDHEGKVAWVSTGFKPNSAIEAANAVRELLGQAPDRTAQIMNAEDIEDIGVPSVRFDEFIAAFLADLVKSDPEKALEVFEKAVEIVETSKEREVWEKTIGDQARSFVCDTLVQLKGQADPVAWYAFHADLLRSGKIPPFELTRIWGEKKLIDALVGSDLKPKVPVENALQTVAESIGNGEFVSLAAPVLNKIVQRYDSDTVSHLLIALKSGESDELSPFLKELEMAIDIQLRMREGYRGRHYSPETTAHYVGALNDDSVPLAIRLLLADFLSVGATPYPNREIVLASAERLAEAWSGDTPVHQFWLQPVLDNFMREDRDEAWKAVARRLGSGFRARYLNDSSPQGMPNVPDDDLINVMMDIYITLDKAETVTAVFERFQKRFADFQEPMFHLIRAGEFEKAGSLLAEKSVTFGRKQFRRPVFDEVLAEKSPAFLETIEKPSLRLLARTLIAEAPDRVAPGDKLLTAVKYGSPNSQRLQAAAKEFENTGISNTLMRRQVLGLLGTDVAAAKIVAEALRSEAEKIGAEAAIEAKAISKIIREGIVTKPDLAVFEGALLLEMAEGNLEKAEAMLEEVAVAEVEVADRKHIFVEQLFDLPGRAILGSEDPSATAEKLIPLCKRLAVGIEGLEPRPDVLERHRQPWAQLTYAMLEAGKMNEFLPWFRETAEGGVYKKKHTLWKDGTVNFLWFASERYRDRPVEERVAFLKDLLGQDWVVDGFHSFTNGGFRNSVTVGLLTRDEMLEHGEAIATASPRNGHAWNDLAFVFDGAGRFDQAAEFWEVASNARQGENAEGEAWQYRAHVVRSLYRQGQIEDAAEAIAEISPENYDSPEVAELRTRIAAGKPLVPNLEALETMAEATLSGAPPIAVKVPRKAVVKKGIGKDEPDPFTAMPAVKEKAAEKGDNVHDGDEPDPFGTQKKAGEKKAGQKRPADGEDEPDPFAAP